MLDNVGITYLFMYFYMNVANTKRYTHFQKFKKFVELAKEKLRQTLLY